MNLERMPFWFLLFFSLSITASAQQATKADIEALATKVSSIEKTVNKIDQRLITVEKTVNDMDKRLISLEIIVKEMDKRITVRIDVLFWAMGTLIGVVLAAITLPQVLGFLQSKRERAEIQQQIRDQRAETQQQIQDLRVEIQDYRAEIRQEIRDLGERLDRQLQVMFEKLNQHQQEIDDLKSHRIVTPS